MSDIPDIMQNIPCQVIHCVLGWNFDGENRQPYLPLLFGSPSTQGPSFALLKLNPYLEVPHVQHSNIQP